MRVTLPFAILALVTLLVTPIPASSVVMTSGCANVDVSCTLGELAQGGAILAGDKLFSEWSVEDFSTLPVPLDDVDVVGLDDALDAGIRYQSAIALSTDGFDLIDLAVSFVVTATDPAMRISGGSVELEAFEFGAGNVGGVVTLFTDLFDLADFLLDASVLTADNFPPPFFVLSDSWAFSPQSSAKVETEILVTGDGGSDVATLSAFSQRFTQIAVPEPPVLALVLVALLAGLAARRRSLPNLRSRLSRARSSS